MAWGAIIGAAIQAIPQVVRMVKGGQQTSQARSGLDNLSRPKYEMPSEMAQALALSKQAYSDPNMPGQGMMYDRAAQSAANAYSAAVQSGNPLAAITNIQSMQNQANQNIGVAAAQQQQQEMAQLQNMLGRVAQFRDTEYQMNEFAPYAEQSQEYRDILSAGEKNQFASMTGMANIGSALMSMIGNQPQAADASSSVDTDQLSSIAKNFNRDDMGSAYNQYMSTSYKNKGEPRTGMMDMGRLMQVLSQINAK